VSEDQASELRRLMKRRGGGRRSRPDVEMAVQEGIDRWSAWMQERGSHLPGKEEMHRLRSELADAVREQTKPREEGDRR
jgi:hypothetical protein